MPTTPSSASPRHLLPRGEKEDVGNLYSSREEEELGGLPSSSPLAGEGGGARSAVSDEGAAVNKARFACKLRKEMTDAEWKLWHALRSRRFDGYKFRRQVPIGIYIADFVCQERKLIVEVDGSQHANSPYDIKRDAWLRLRGYRVLRFWNIDIFEALDGTLSVILTSLRAPPHPSRGLRRDPFSPARGEGEEAKS
jgi:very-short-patch-repair endonuclease